MSVTITIQPAVLPPRLVSRVWTLPEPAPTSQSDLQRFVIAPDDVQGTDPFIILAEDWFSKVGFDWHPHRGFETVTYVIDGELEHKDSTGAHEVLRAGDAQWTTMGWQVLHAELAYQRKGVHTLQLWLNTPAAQKRGEARYQNLRASEVPILEESGVKVRVYSGQVKGVQGLAENIWPTTLIDAQMRAGSRFVHEIPGNYVAFFYVLKGSVVVGEGDTLVKAGQVAWFDATEGDLTGIELMAEEETHLIAYASAPIGEPIVAYGPFVMNTREEINQAFADYRRGLFGPIPAW